MRALQKESRDLAALTESGRPFHNLAAATLKARSPKFDEVFEMVRMSLLLDLRLRIGLWTVRSEVRYLGARLVFVNNHEDFVLNSLWYGKPVEVLQNGCDVIMPGALGDDSCRCVLKTLEAP